ncbi:MAG: T9SS type A sorting domain-containing protein, partial [Bacteroidetes bacterium]|nr:T9SS type A sorting domain-containing protein [Bacteroidota bacterium]
NCYLVPYKILATPDGGCMITAGIYDYVNSPNMQHDIYIIKLDANGGITSVNNLTPQPDKSVSLYPVPAQHQLFVSFSGSGHFDLQLYDMAGKMVGSYPNLDKQTRSLDISTLASGSYFYTVKHSNGSTETGKWIKE